MRVVLDLATILARLAGASHTRLGFLRMEGLSGEPALEISAVETERKLRRVEISLPRLMRQTYGESYER